MLPSASDRRAWLPFSLLFAGLFGFSLLVGAGPWMLQNLTPAFNTTMRAIAIVAGITIFIHLLVLLPFWALHRLLAYLTGLDVN
jgi:hypothetical protein